MWALLLALFVLLTLPFASSLALSILATWLGFFGFGWYGPWVAYLTESAPPTRVDFALGLAMAVNQIAIIASPPLLGSLRDLTGSYAIDWVLLIALLTLSLGVAWLRPALR